MGRALFKYQVLADEHLQKRTYVRIMSATTKKGVTPWIIRRSRTVYFL
ncbi:hypothetical protein N624_2664 [Levilactobacillus brevis]|nr:hypothetical protein N624_2664 [Levilactobacillus brevis]